MAIERAGGITFKGKPFTAVGPVLKPGDRAPEATLVAPDLSEVKLLEATAGKTRLFSAILSVETSICDPQTRRFDEEVAKLPNVVAVTLTMDLPFTLKRYCGAAGVKHLVLSDHRDAAFGSAYGILAKEMRTLGRAVFVVGVNGTVTYAAYNKEIAEPVNFEAALAAVKAAA